MEQANGPVWKIYYFVDSPEEDDEDMVNLRRPSSSVSIEELPEDEFPDVFSPDESEISSSSDSVQSFHSSLHQIECAQTDKSVYPGAENSEPPDSYEPPPSQSNDPQFMRKVVDQNDIDESDGSGEFGFERCSISGVETFNNHDDDLLDALSYVKGISPTENPSDNIDSIMGLTSNQPRQRMGQLQLLSRQKKDLCDENYPSFMVNITDQQINYFPMCVIENSESLKKFGGIVAIPTEKYHPYTDRDKGQCEIMSHKISKIVNARVNLGFLNTTFILEKEQIRKKYNMWEYKLLVPDPPGGESVTEDLVFDMIACGQNITLPTVMSRTMFDKFAFGFNFNKLGDDLDDPDLFAPSPVLDYVKKPMMDYTLLGTIFPIFSGKQGLGVVQYLHKGAERVYFVIPPSQKVKFETLLENCFPENSLYCPGFYTHDKLFILPKQLEINKIKFTKMILKPGCFLILTSGSYCFGYSTGFSVGERRHYLLPENYKFFKMDKNKCICVWPDSKSQLRRENVVRKYERERIHLFLSGNEMDYIPWENDGVLRRVLSDSERLQIEVGDSSVRDDGIFTESLSNNTTGKSRKGESQHPSHVNKKTKSQIEPPCTSSSGGNKGGPSAHSIPNKTASTKLPKQNIKTTNPTAKNIVDAEHDATLVFQSSGGGKVTLRRNANQTNNPCQNRDVGLVIINGKVIRITSPHTAASGTLHEIPVAQQHSESDSNYEADYDEETTDSE